MTIKDSLRSVLTMLIIMGILSLVILIPTGIAVVTFKVVYDFTDPSPYMAEVQSEPLDQDIKYDVVVYNLENKFVEMEGVGLGGAGAGGIASTQAYVSKETFINLTGEVFYNENTIQGKNSRYYFVQTYWTVESNILLIYEKTYTPPGPYTIEKGENELIYHLMDNSNTGIACSWSIVSWIISFVILVIIYITKEWYEYG